MLTAHGAGCAYRFAPTLKNRATGSERSMLWEGHWFTAYVPSARAILSAIGNANLKRALVGNTCFCRGGRDKKSFPGGKYFSRVTEDFVRERFIQLDTFPDHGSGRR
uniref:HDC11597 n=1 Tax=Drosophila melanogaster TaxID=7227 RepID=Q6IKS2_DROME|nr:TPA_inf: HDC11597 [Drosophila melanogaster]